MVDELIADYRSENGIAPRKISDEEIVERCVYALVNEGARILEEGIAQRASDIDMVYLTGYGFPLHPRRPDVLRRHASGLYNVVRTHRSASRPQPGDDALLEAGGAAGAARRRRQDLQLGGRIATQKRTDSHRS